MSLVNNIVRGVQPRQVIDRGSFLGGYPFELGPDGFGLILQQTLVGNREQVAPEYVAFLHHAYKSSAVLFACIANRMQLFRQARFQFRRFSGGRPGDLFGSAELGILERPWPNGTTGDLLALAELHSTCAGNFFVTRRELPGGPQLRVMRPDWTWIVLGSLDDDAVGPLDLDAEVIGYLYQEGGPGGGRDARLLLPETVAHYMPFPDGEVPFRGVSWLTAVIQEMLADKAMTSHRKKFLEAGATPNLAIKLNTDKIEDFNKLVQLYAEAREGAGLDVNPYKTMFLMATADPIPIGVDLKALDFASVQAAGEVRIAAAAMVHPAVAAFTSGLQGSALNAGNFDSAFRQFANGTIRPLWQAVAGALQTVVKVPDVAELWYDDRGVPALAEDTKKAADITGEKAKTLSTLFMAGADWDAAVDAVETNDLSGLKGKHSGLASVQVQPSSNGAKPAQEPAPTP